MAHEAPQLENEGVGSELTDDVLFTSSIFTMKLVNSWIEDCKSEVEAHANRVMDVVL